MACTHPAIINGIDTAILQGAAAGVAADPAKGAAKFHVKTAWQGGARSESRAKSFELGGQVLPRDYTLRTDAPSALIGTTEAANPQEVFMSALNSCMVVGFAAAASARGITLEKLEIETEGDLDLRGFLGLDDTVTPGYEQLRYTVYVKGNGTAEQYREIHQTVVATSPVRYSIENGVHLESQLVVEV